MCEGEFKVFFGDQAFIKVGLPIGEDFVLVLGHAGAGQAFETAMNAISSVIRSFL